MKANKVFSILFLGLMPSMSFGQINIPQGNCQPITTTLSTYSLRDSVTLIAAKATPTKNSKQISKSTCIPQTSILTTSKNQTVVLSGVKNTSTKAQSMSKSNCIPIVSEKSEKHIPATLSNVE